MGPNRNDVVVATILTTFLLISAAEARYLQNLEQIGYGRIVDEASAETAAKEAVGYAIVVAIITAAIATASVFYGRPVGGFDAWNYLDAALVGGIAFGLWKRSRFAAVAGVVYWMISAAVKLADGQRFGIVTLLILLGFIHGIRGTFALAKYRKAVDTVGHHSR